MSVIYLSADRLFPGVGSTMVRPTVTIRDQFIDSVQNSLLGAPGCAEHRYDFPGCTILPGLIDTHVHLIFSALDTSEAIIAQVTSETDEQLYARAAENALKALHVGITTVRDCGGRGTIIQRLRQDIASGNLTGCDVISCGVPITTTSGHCHWLGLIANNADEVRQAVQKMLSENVDWLKVMATGGNMTASSNPMLAQYNDDTLAMIADMGRAAGKHSAAHVLSKSAMPGVVKANFRTIEHCNWRIDESTYEFDRDLGRRIIDQQQYVGITMSALTRRAFLPPPPQMNAYAAEENLNRRFVCEREMLDFGVPYTLHTDAGVPRTPIDGLALGLRAAVLELRLTPIEAITAVTASAAKALDLSDRGILQSGKLADLVVVEGNPLQDIAALHNIRAVMKRGQWVFGDVKPEPVKSSEK